MTPVIVTHQRCITTRILILILLQEPHMDGKLVNGIHKFSDHKVQEFDEYLINKPDEEQRGQLMKLMRMIKEEG